MIAPLSPAQQREVEDWLPYVKVVAGSLNVPLPFEDRVQEGAIGAIEAVRTFDPTRGRTMKSHVYGVVRDRIIDATRRWAGDTRKQRTRPVLVGLEDRHATLDAANDVVTRLGFEQALVGLRDREVLELHLRDGLTLAEVGARLGFGESRACQRFQRARSALARRLGD